MSTPPKAGARESDTLANVMGILRRRWIMIVAIVIACTAVAVAKHVRTTKSYQATSNVAFQSGTLSEAGLQVSPSGSREPQREADTEVLIAHSPEVAEAVRRHLHLSASASELLGEVKVEAAPERRRAEHRNATAGDPREAAQLANAFAEQYIAFRTQSQLAGINAAQHEAPAADRAAAGGVARTGALAAVACSASSELRAVAGGGANIIGRATPPSSPSGSGLTSSRSLIGLLIGLAIAFALVFLLESLDRRIKTIEEFEREYRLPVLAAVPQSAFRARDAEGPRRAARALSDPAQRARLRRRHPRARHPARDERRRPARARRPSRSTSRTRSR